MSKFTNILIVSPLADGKTWILHDPLSYDVGTEGSGDRITVPHGFKADFSSVPRPLWRWLSPWGKHGNAAVIHDYLYWMQTRPRRTADDIFLEAMTVLEVPPLDKRLMYWAVRIFGGLVWRSNQRKKQEGYSKVAGIMPTKAGQMPREV
jgi:Protein of unknown function (DUF1353)